MTFSKRLITLSIATLLTAFLGLYNNFPFLYPDSNSYLDCGINLHVPDSRPIFYGLFLRACHLMDNLYFVVYVQSFLFAWAFYMPFKLLLQGNSTQAKYLIVVATLVLCTAYSFFACYLIPDLFTPILFLMTWLLFFVPMNNWDKSKCIALLLLSILVHNTHFFLFIALACVAPFLVKKQDNSSFSLKKHSFFTVGIILSFFLVNGGVNFVFKHDGILPKDGHFFFTSRLNETGILQEFLNRKCTEKTYILCPFKDSLTVDFLWDPQSPMHKVGGWQANSADYQTMLKDMIADPFTLKRILVMSLNSTILQLGTFEIEPQSKQVPGIIKKHFPVHKTDIDFSFQNRDSYHRRLEFRDLNNRQTFAVLISFLMICIYLMFETNSNPQAKVSMKLLLIFLVLNAFICGTLSTVITRYQGRIIYLLPYLALFWHTEIWKSLRSIFSKEEYG